MLQTTQGTRESPLEESKTTEGTLDGALEKSDKMLQTATEGTLDGASEESDTILQTATEGTLEGGTEESDKMLQTTEGTLEGASNESDKMLHELTEGTLDGTFEPKNRKFDDILQEVGDFSKFQYIQWTILVLITMPQVWYTYAPAFAARKVKDQLSCSNHDNITGGKAVCQIWHNKTYCGDVKYSTDFTSIATDWDIICEDAKKYIPLTKTIFYAGKLVGAYLFGWVSDRYGRRVTLLSTIFIQFVSSLIQSFSVNLTMYVLLRIPLGICSGGVLIAAFTLMTEMVRPNRRMWGTTIIMATLGVSLTVTSFMAYLVRDWKQFNLAITLPNILAIIACLCFVSESPRWLTARGRFKEADKILVKMASTNRKEYKKGQVEEITIKEKKKTYHIWHLFSTRYLTRISVIEGWSWMVTSGVFYGIAFNSSNLSGNFYLNYAASGMAEIPAPLFAGFLLERVGRRKPLIVYYLLSGIFLLSISRIQALGKQDELSAVVMALALVGKTTISAAYYQIYIFSAELYPTVIRVAGMGFASLCGRIGGMAAPYIVDSTSLTVPCIVFGVASITAGIATLFLPETLGKHLQDQIEQDRRKNGKTVDKVHMIEIE